MSKHTVAVITSTIGRPELERAILSVQAQTYPTKHYVFVDGTQYHCAAQAILSRYPDVIPIYLPMNTGADGWSNSSINAIAPFLIKEEIICYLDDDNWYTPNHIEKGVQVLVTHQADYAYSLRNFYDLQGNFICVDTIESIGEYTKGYQDPFNIYITDHKRDTSFLIQLRHNTRDHIDTNCYFFKTEVARNFSTVWHSNKYNDRAVSVALKNSTLKGICTKTISVNYSLDIKKYSNLPSLLQGEPYCFSEDEAMLCAIRITCEQSKVSFEGWGNQYIWDVA